MSTTEDRKPDGHREADGPTDAVPRPSWQRFAGLGFELFVVVFGAVLLGTWIDRSYNTGPWGVLICAILGILGGLYNLIRSALKALDSSDSSARARREGDDRD